MTIYKTCLSDSIDKHILRSFNKMKNKNNNKSNTDKQRYTQNMLNGSREGFFSFIHINLVWLCVYVVPLHYRSIEKTHVFVFHNNSLFVSMFFIFFVWRIRAVQCIGNGFLFSSCNSKRCNICLLLFSYIDFASKMYSHTETHTHNVLVESICKKERVLFRMNMNFEWCSFLFGCADCVFFFRVQLMLSRLSLARRFPWMCASVWTLSLFIDLDRLYSFALLHWPAYW